MRRESSTVLVLVGDVGETLLAELGRSGNVSVVRAPEAPGAGGRPGWETGALALREATRRQSPYVVVADDPLADVAAAWRAMWDLTGGSEGAVRFEECAAEALVAWREKRFELPDYYLRIASAQANGTGPDLYLGALRAARPHRVIADVAEGPDQAMRVLDTLRSLAHGPWWPPLDELIDQARRFYAGSLATGQPNPGQA